MKLLFNLFCTTGKKESPKIHYQSVTGVVRTIPDNSTLRFDFLFPIESQARLVRYSYLKLSTGFARAALIACVLTVSSAITNARPPAKANTHQVMATR